MFTEYALGLMSNILAGLIGAALVLWIVDRRKRISLKIEITNSYQDTTRTNLGVSVKNKSLPWWLSWAYDGEPASMCRAWISFLNLDGTRYYELEMMGRWSSTAEPVKPVFEGGHIRWIPRTESELSDWVDIPSGESETLDIAVKFRNEDECFGWNTDSYFYDFKNPHFRLKSGRYIVQVRVKTGGRDYKALFYLFNEGDFRLEKVTNKKLPPIPDARVQQRGSMVFPIVDLTPQPNPVESPQTDEMDQPYDVELETKDVRFGWTVDYDDDPQMLVLKFVNQTSEPIAVEYAELWSPTKHFNIERDGIIARNAIIPPREPWIIRVPFVSRFQPQMFQKKVVYPDLGSVGSVRVYGAHKGQKVRIYRLIASYTELQTD